MNGRKEIQELLYKMWQSFAGEIDVRHQDTIKIYIEAQDRILEILQNGIDCAECPLATRGRRVA